MLFVSYILKSLKNYPVIIGHVNIGIIFYNLFLTIQKPSASQTLHDPHKQPT